MTLRVGTRGSALATAQAGDVARWITERTGAATELTLVTTHGDISRESLSSLGGTGVFASALRDSLLAGACDIVVHSMKDLPTAPFPGLDIAAVPGRADARDALCARDGLTLSELPVGAQVGTGSPRRVAQLRAARPDIQVIDIRGNIDTRLGFVDSGTLDAVVLAVAGLERLGRTERITERFDLDSWPTAPAQGALAIEVRGGDDADEGSDIGRAVRAVADPTAAATAIAERMVLRTLEAGCAAPIGARAWIAGETIEVAASVYAIDGSSAISRTASAPLPAGVIGGAFPAYTDSTADGLADAARAAGGDLAQALLDGGAAALAPLDRSR